MLDAMLCRFNLHAWQEEVTDGGIHIRQCRRCHKREEMLGPGGDDAGGMH